jgi:integrase/recombinase XerC
MNLIDFIQGALEKQMNNVMYRNLFIEYLTGCGLKDTSIKRMKCGLKTFYTFLNGKDIKDVGEKIIFNYIKHLEKTDSRYGKKLSKLTIENYLKTLKSFYLFLTKNEYILANPMENIPIQQNGNSRLISMFAPDEINSFLDSIEEERDRAYFELLYSSGLRAKEGLELTLEDVNFTERIIFIKNGKGAKDRYVPFSETALKFMLLYAGNERKKQQERLNDPESKKWFFLSETGKLSYFSIRKVFKKNLAKCNLLNKGLRIHSIRHSVATHLLEEGASIRYVQELLGHANIDTTQIYARPNVENIRRVYKTFHPRENEYFEEIESDYLKNLGILKKKLIICRNEKRRKKLLKKD